MVCKLLKKEGITSSLQGRNDTIAKGLNDIIKVALSDDKCSSQILGKLGDRNTSFAADEMNSSSYETKKKNSFSEILKKKKGVKTLVQGKSKDNKGDEDPVSRHV